MAAVTAWMLDAEGHPVVAGPPDRDIWREVMETYQGPLLGYAKGILDDGDLARDVVQDTFVRLHGELRKQVPENLKAWLFRVCRNRALDVLRKNRRLQLADAAELEEVADEGREHPGRSAETKESHERAMELLQRLPENQREVIRLKFQGGLSYREISEVTGLTVGHVGYLLHHGLKNLRELMHEPE